MPKDIYRCSQRKTQKSHEDAEVDPPEIPKIPQEWMPRAKWKNYVIDTLYMPLNLNWKALKKAYEFQPRDYEELLNIKGVGPATARGLALISQLIYSKPPSWKDPVKYAFAYGEKTAYLTQ